MRIVVAMVAGGGVALVAEEVRRRWRRPAPPIRGAHLLDEYRGPER